MKPAAKTSLGRPFWWLVAACALSVIAGLFNHWHPHFEAEAWPGFFAACGFVAVVVSVLISRALSTLLRRPEDFYGDPSDSEVRHD